MQRTRAQRTTSGARSAHDRAQAPGNHMLGRQLVHDHDQQARWRDDVQRGDGPPFVRGLLQAAGMAPSVDEGLVSGGPSAGFRMAGLPLADMLETHPNGSRHYATTTIDDRGRLADRTPLKIMGWEPGTPATISMIPVAGIILVRREGPDAVTRQGHLRLPVNIRHGCRLRGGDRLLVAAHPAEGVLLAYTPFAVDAMTSAYHASAPTEDVA